MEDKKLPLTITIDQGKLTLEVDTPQRGYFNRCKSYTHLLNSVIDELRKGGRQYRLIIDESVNSQLDAYQLKAINNIVDLVNSYESKSHE